MKMGLIFCFLFLNWTLATSSVANQVLDVVINEIAWMGTRENWRYEWLELYNNTKIPISLNGWKIELYRANLDWSLELKGIIPAEGYFLIVASDKIFSHHDLNYSNLGGKFNNNGQKILLKDNLGNVIDEVDCYSSGKWFAGNNETKQTIERINSLVSVSDFSNWQTSQNPNGTPKAKNSLKEKPELPTETKSQLREKELAAMAEQFPKEIHLSFLPFIIALTIAISSGTIILMLKRKIKNLT